MNWIVLIRPFFSEAVNKKIPIVFHVFGFNQQCWLNPHQNAEISISFSIILFEQTSGTDLNRFRPAQHYHRHLKKHLLKFWCDWTLKTIPKTPTTSGEVLLMGETLHHCIKPSGIFPLKVGYFPMEGGAFSYGEWYPITSPYFLVDFQMTKS